MPDNVSRERPPLVFPIVLIVIGVLFLYANYRPAFDAAYRLSFQWGFIISFALGLLWYFGGDAVIGLMTTNEAVRQYAHDYLWIAALGALFFMPAFVYDGILIGLTQNVAMRNVMVASLGIFLVAALVLKIPFGNLGLWFSLHLWFIARGGFYWWSLERRRAKKTAEEIKYLRESSERVVDSMMATFPPKVVAAYAALKQHRGAASTPAGAAPRPAPSSSHV